MPRKPTPYFRKQAKAWYFSTGGKRYSLGKDKKAAFQKFHEIMADKESLTSQLSTLYELSQAYLDWCQVNRSEGTYENYRRFLKSFIGHVGKQLKIGSLKNHHLNTWIDKQPSWGSTYKNDAISRVLTALNWAVEQGYIPRSPITKIIKPKKKRREVFYSPEQWELIRSQVKDCFGDYIDFLWATGCRPKEARELEARHVDLQNNIVLMPSSESKGEIARVLFLTPESQSILQKLVEAYPTGRLFRNTRGSAWTKESVRCRMMRISAKVGFRVIAYGTRHSYATEGLKNGVDSIVIAHLMGHKDTSMVAKVYSHLAKNPKYLAEQACKVKTE